MSGKAGSGTKQPAVRSPAHVLGEEAADIVAYLEQRRDNAATLAKWHGDQADETELAHDRRRQLDVQIDDIRAGLHVGCAAVREQLTKQPIRETTR